VQINQRRLISRLLKEDSNKRVLRRFGNESGVWDERLEGENSRLLVLQDGMSGTKREINARTCNYMQINNKN